MEYRGVNYGYSLLQLGRWSAASEAANRALALKPNLKAAAELLQHIRQAQATQPPARP
jgi:hypothetical protein